MSEDRYVEQVTATVSASPAEVFALLADPHRHPDIDGSGTVRRVRASSAPLRVGSIFDMHMRRGFDYSTRNTVLELEPDRVIAWQTAPLSGPLPWFIGGRIWRYELAPDDAGTRVTETWDLRPERNRALVRLLAGDPAGDMRTTLQRLGRLLESRA